MTSSSVPPTRPDSFDFSPAILHDQKGAITASNINKYIKTSADAVALLNCRQDELSKKFYQTVSSDTPFAGTIERKGLNVRWYKEQTTRISKNIQDLKEQLPAQKNTNQVLKFQRQINVLENQLDDLEKKQSNFIQLINLREKIIDHISGVEKNPVETAETLQRLLASFKETYPENPTATDRHSINLLVKALQVCQNHATTDQERKKIAAILTEAPAFKKEPTIAITQPNAPKLARRVQHTATKLLKVESNMQKRMNSLVAGIAKKATSTATLPTEINAFDETIKKLELELDSARQELKKHPESASKRETLGTMLFWEAKIGQMKVQLENLKEMNELSYRNFFQAEDAILQHLGSASKQPLQAGLKVFSAKLIADTLQGPLEKRVSLLQQTVGHHGKYLLELSREEKRVQDEILNGTKDIKKVDQNILNSMVIKQMVQKLSFGSSDAQPNAQLNRLLTMMEKEELIDSLIRQDPQVKNILHSYKYRFPETKTALSSTELLELSIEVASKIDSKIEQFIKQDKNIKSFLKPFLEVDRRAVYYHEAKELLKILKKNNPEGKPFDYSTQENRLTALLENDFLKLSRADRTMRSLVLSLPTDHNFLNNLEQIAVVLEAEMARAVYLPPGFEKDNAIRDATMMLNFLRRPVGQEPGPPLKRAVNRLLVQDDTQPLYDAYMAVATTSGLVAPRDKAYDRKAVNLDVASLFALGQLREVCKNQTKKPIAERFNIVRENIHTLAEGPQIAEKSQKKNLEAQFLAGLQEVSPFVNQMITEFKTNKNNFEKAKIACALHDLIGDLQIQERPYIAEAIQKLTQQAQDLLTDACQLSKAEQAEPLDMNTRLTIATKQMTLATISQNAEIRQSAFVVLESTLSPLGDKVNELLMPKDNESNANAMQQLLAAFARKNSLIGAKMTELDQNMQAMSVTTQTWQEYLKLKGEADKLIKSINGTVATSWLNEIRDSIVPKLPADLPKNIEKALLTHLETLTKLPNDLLIESIKTLLTSAGNESRWLRMLFSKLEDTAQIERCQKLLIDATNPAKRFERQALIGQFGEICFEFVKMQACLQALQPFLTETQVYGVLIETINQCSSMLASIRGLEEEQKNQLDALAKEMQNPASLPSLMGTQDTKQRNFKTELIKILMETKDPHVLVGSINPENILKINQNVASLFKALPSIEKAIEDSKFDANVREKLANSLTQKKDPINKKLSQLMAQFITRQILTSKEALKFTPNPEVRSRLVESLFGAIAVAEQMNTDILY